MSLFDLSVAELVAKIEVLEARIDVRAGRRAR